MSQPDSPAVGGSKAAGRAGEETKSPGENTKSPHYLVLSCVPNLVSFCKRNQHNLTAASGSQTWRSLSTSPGLTERVIQIFQHALAPSQALSERVCCTSPLMLPKRETLTLSYTEGALRRHAPTWLLSPGKNFLLQQLFPTLTHKNNIVSTFPSF